MSYVSVANPTLIAEGLDRRVTLTWHVNSQSGIKGFIVYRDYNAIARLTPNATTYTNFGLGTNTEYVYHLVAEARAGYFSSVSNIVAVRTMNICRPSAPREFNVLIEPSKQRATISWVDPAVYGCSDYVIYDYSVVISYNNGVNKLSSENNTKRTQLIIDNLPDVVGYDIRVRANNGIYVSNWVTSVYGIISSD